MGVSKMTKIPKITVLALATAPTALEKSFASSALLQSSRSEPPAPSIVELRLLNRNDSVTRVREV